MKKLFLILSICLTTFTIQANEYQTITLQGHGNATLPAVAKHQAIKEIEEQYRNLSTDMVYKGETIIETFEYYDYTIKSYSHIICNLNIQGKMETGNPTTLQNKVYKLLGCKEYSKDNDYNIICELTPEKAKELYNYLKNESKDPNNGLTTCENHFYNKITHKKLYIDEPVQKGIIFANMSYKEYFDAGLKYRKGKMFIKHKEKDGTVLYIGHLERNEYDFIKTNLKYQFSYLGD